MVTQGIQVAPANEPLDSPVLKYRIEGIRESAKRARLAFLASTIASLCIFIAEYNAYLSWYFWRISQPGAVDPQRFDKLLDLYVQNPVINISLLGIRIGEGDLVVLGSLTLFAFSVWLYFSMKTYNDLITGLLQETQDSSKEVKTLVFSGIYSFLMFTTVMLYDSPAAEKRGAWKQSRVVTILYMLPAAAVGFVLLTDLLSLFLLPAPFTPDSKWPLWPRLTLRLEIIAAIFIGVGFRILILVARRSRKIIDIDYSTASRIREYKTWS